MRPTISLTFDDGLPCQIEHALPELDARGLRATFFLIANSPYDSAFRREVWYAAAAAGHEIGSHSVNHRKAAQLAPAEAFREAYESRMFLEGELGQAVSSFAYPFTDAPSHLQEAVKQAGYQQARGGRSAAADKYLTSAATNLLCTPCFHVNVASVGSVRDWVAVARARQAWVTLMLHGVGPDHSQWDNISVADFCALLDALREIDVLPYGEAAARLRCA